ncbi:MAG: adenylosuccinate lyase [Flavobacteriaceae bacterium]
MTKEQISNELEHMSALRVSRQRVANLVVQDENNFKQLLDIVFDVDNKTSIKAAWVVEFVCKDKMLWLYNHLDYFTKNMHKAHFGSVVRPLAKICELLVLQNKRTPKLNFTLKHKQRIAETTFDWLISDHKVAVKAYSMTSLFILGKEIDWIHEELKMIIISNINDSSKAYEARGKFVLKEIEKLNLKKRK